MENPNQLKNEKQKNTRAASRVDFKLPPSRAAEIICAILAAVTAVIVWLFSSPV